MSFDCLKVLRAPSQGFDKQSFLERMYGMDFMVLYDLKLRTTNIFAGSGALAKAESALQGMPIEMSRSNLPLEPGCMCKVIAPYRSKNTAAEGLFSDIFESGNASGYLGIAFISASGKDLEESKRFAETLLSGREVKETSSVQGLFSPRGKSYHRDIFLGSEEGLALSEMLDSLNMSSLSNNIAFKPYVISIGCEGSMPGYLSKKFIPMAERDIGIDFLEMGKSLSEMPQFACGSDMLSMFLSLDCGAMATHPVRLARPLSSGDLQLGTFLSEGVAHTGIAVSIDRSSLNLGAIICGMPGSGKTSGAQAIISQLLSSGERPMVLVIAPTPEWDGFADSMGLHLVRMCSDNLPINFFECKSSNVRRFYEDLSMLIASASNNGPFRNPTEKCLLSAFRRAYSKSNAPDPVEVYEGIEDSVVRFHAKRTPSGIKYTKHGENIRSGLESIRSILSMPEYSAKSGIDIKRIMAEGVVFDTSAVSNRMKPYIYALILNQAYSIASDFDTNADSKLRLLICIEEAQIIFKDRHSPATEDIRNRIQDFRKQGVGLLLMAHNVDDIEQDIRRLCQIKLYLKQAADVAECAAKDLSFAYPDEEDVAQKLKHLDSRMAALNYIIKDGGEKLSPDTTFVRTLDYVPHRARRKGAMPFPGNMHAPKVIKCRIAINIRQSAMAQQRDNDATCGVKLYYLSEEITDGIDVSVSDDSIVVECDLVEAKSHSISILDKRGRVIKSMRFIASEDVRLAI